MSKAAKGVTDWILGISMPSLMSEVEIPVYMIHNSPHPNDYFFLFDFEEFVDRSAKGFFVRPMLRVFAGRDDFSRSQFASDFRQVFSHEFDRMRDEMSQSTGKRGWLDWNIGIGAVSDMVGGFVANLVLAVALSVGKKLIGQISLPNLFKGKSTEAKLVDEIDRTKTLVEAALERIEITLHRELYDHAYRDGPMGKISGLDREAWPLPGYVRRHLEQGKSGAWW